MTKKIKVGIIGASGYTGQELASVLVADDQVEIVFLRSESESGKKSIAVDLEYQSLTEDNMLKKGVDAVFFCTPNGVAMNQAKKFLENEIKVIDLSADFRFLDPNIFEQVYNQKHVFFDANCAVEYGLTEIFYDKISKADIVANPGCYVTACLLTVLPIKDMIETVVFDCKSGYSGAGKNFNLKKELAENVIMPYNTAKHRHLPEIQQFVNVPIYFTPHLINKFRGIESTCHFILKKEYVKTNFYSLFKEVYKDCPHVKIQKEIPTISQVENSNDAIVGGFELDNQGRLVIVSILDNLRKGAASQAVQNLHAMFGLSKEIANPKKHLDHDF